MNESPRERLRRWVEEQPSRAAAAKAIGCHPSYLTHLLAPESERGLGLDVAFGIERATKDWSDGPIEAREWVTLPEQPDDELAPTGTGAS